MESKLNPIKLERVYSLARVIEGNAMRLRGALDQQTRKAYLEELKLKIQELEKAVHSLGEDRV